MRINERNVALQDINEHSAIAVNGVHQISNKADLYSKAGLDFEVESVNLGKATGNDNYDRFYGLRNQKTGHVYTVTGRKYTPIQNHELIDAFDEVRQMYGAEYKNAGVMREVVGSGCKLNCRRNILLRFPTGRVIRLILCSRC